MKKLLFSAAALTLLFASSCGKDDDNNGPTRRDVLIAGKWQLTAGTLTATGLPLPPTDVLTLIQECQKDDRLLFRSDMRTISDAGTVKCDTVTAQQTDLGAWAITADQTKLTFPTPLGILGTLTANIDQLDNTTLKLSGTGSKDTLGTTVGYTYNVTFTNKP